MKRHIIIAAMVFVFASLGSASAQWQSPQFAPPQFRSPVFQPIQFQSPVFQQPQFQTAQFQVVQFQNGQFVAPQGTVPVRPVIQRFQPAQFQVTSGVRPEPGYRGKGRQ